MKKTYLKPTMISVRLKPSKLMQNGSMKLSGDSATTSGGAYTKDLGRGASNFWDDEDDY